MTKDEFLCAQVSRSNNKKENVAQLLREYFPKEGLFTSGIDFLGVLEACRTYSHQSLVFFAQQDFVLEF